MFSHAVRACNHRARLRACNLLSHDTQVRDKCQLLIFEAKVEFKLVKSVNLKLLVTCFDALR